jgi:hypothetical protein
MIGASLDKLCEICQERFRPPGQRTCEGCAIFDEDDGRDCPSCGAITANDGTCVCDLNWPRQDSTHWQDR